MTDHVLYLSTLGDAAPPDTATPHQWPLAVSALLWLILVTPLDGFRTITYMIGLGPSPPTMIGYVAAALMVPYVGEMFRYHDRSFWLIVLTYAIGTLLAMAATARGGVGIQYELTTGWQMLVLWTFTLFAAVRSSVADVVRYFVWGLLLATAAFVTLYLLKIDTVEDAERVLVVGGFQTNAASVAVAFSILLAAGTFFGLPRSLRYTMVWFGFPAALYVLIKCNSRGAILTLLAGLLVYAVPRRGSRRYRKARLSVVVLGSLSLLFVLVGPDDAFADYQRILGRWDTSAGVSQLTTQRSDILQEGYRLTMDNPMGFGTGVSKFELGRSGIALEYDVLDPHNEFLRVALECGWVGLVLYLGAFGTLTFRAWRLWRRSDIAWPLAVIIATIVRFQSASGGYDKLTWIVIGLVSAAIRADAVNRRRSGVLLPN